MVTFRLVLKWTIDLQSVWPKKYFREKSREKRNHLIVLDAWAWLYLCASQVLFYEVILCHVS